MEQVICNMKGRCGDDHWSPPCGGSTLHDPCNECGKCPQNKTASCIVPLERNAFRKWRKSLLNSSIRSYGKHFLATFYPDVRDPVLESINNRTALEIIKKCYTKQENN